MPFFSAKVPQDFPDQQRLDKFIASLPNGMNRSKLKSGVTEILVNGKKVDIPSYILKEGDEIKVRAKSSQVFKDIIEMVDQAQAPAWISVDAENQTIKVERLPEREEIDPEFKEQLIIEFYSK